MKNKYYSEFPHQMETPSEKKMREIVEQNKENGENWEQSADFVQLVFDSNELPSRRFMRRRNNG
jgi:hypothetical protein